MAGLQYFTTEQENYIRKLLDKEIAAQEKPPQELLEIRDFFNET